MQCFLIQLRDGTSQVFVQYRDEWTQEGPAGRMRREPGELPPNLVPALRTIARSQVETILGREIEWLKEPPPEPIVRVVSREVAALAVALAVWMGLSLLIVAFAWRLTYGFWFVLLLPIYLPAPIAALIYTLMVHPRSRHQRVRRAVLLAALGLALSFPWPLNPLDLPTRAFVLFHPLPEDSDGVGGIVILLSLWLVGPLYCGCSGYWAGRLADLMLDRRARTRRGSQTTA